MKTRHRLVRIAVCVTAATALGVVVGSATDSQDGPAANDNVASGDLLDGWANRDADIGALASVRADSRQHELRARGCGTGDSSEGAPSQQVAPEPLDAATNADAVNGFLGSILDGWGNRDMDIGAFGQ